MSDPYRTAPTSDLYALYLRVYIATMTGGAVPSGASSREEQAIAYGIEDAMAYRAACEGKDAVRRRANGDSGAPHIIGIRTRYDVIQNIDDNESPAGPDEDNE